MPTIYVRTAQMRLRHTARGKFRRRQRLGRLAPFHSYALTARHARRRRATPVRARAPNGREEHANDLEEGTEIDHVSGVQDVVLVEGEDDDDDVEDDGKDEVEDGDPEQGLEAAGVRTCAGTQELANVADDCGDWHTAAAVGENAGQCSALASERVGFVEPQKK